MKRTLTHLKTAFVGLFFAGLSFPFWALLAGIDTHGQLNEKRRLAPLPALHWNKQGLHDFHEEFPNYVNDHFAFRQILIRWNSMLVYGALKLDCSTRAMVGKEGWLFLPGEGGGWTCSQDESLALWKTELLKRQAWFDRKGICFLAVIIPIKSTIYPEYLPSWISYPGRNSDLDHFIRELNKAGVRTLDLREPLLEAKSLGRLYHKTDTHWNDLGAYVGYRSILRALAGWFPTLRLHPLTDFEQTTFRWPGLNLAEMLALEPFFQEDVINLSPRFRPRGQLIHFQQVSSHKELGEHLLVTTAPDASLPKVLILRDSFCTPLIPLLAEHFSRALFIWSYSFNEQLFEQEHPQVVINAIVESSLNNTPASIAGDSSGDPFIGLQPIPGPPPDTNLSDDLLRLKRKT